MKNKSTELVQVIKENNDTIVEMLLKQGVNPNEPMPEEDVQFYTGATTPLMAAARQKNVVILKQLVQYGLKIDGPEPLRAAMYPNCSLERRLSEQEIRIRMIETVKYLVLHGADINASDPLKHLTPFLIAIYDNDLELVTYFIEQGAQVNQVSKNRYGENVTPFLAAIEMHNAQIVKLLLEHGADPEQNTSDRIRPLQYVFAIQEKLLEEQQLRKNLSTNNDKIINLLVKNGAKEESFYP